MKLLNCNNNPRVKMFRMLLFNMYVDLKIYFPIADVIVILKIIDIIARSDILN